MTRVEMVLELSELQARVAEQDALIATFKGKLSEAKEAAQEQIAKLEAKVAFLTLDVRNGDIYNAELGAENATLREHASAMWSRWADSLWHGDDAARPAQPADCSTDAAWALLFQRAADVLAEGAREIETLEGEKREGAEAIFALADKVAEMQAEGRL